MLTVIASLILSLFQISGIRENMREIRAHLKAVVQKLSAVDLEIAKLM